MLLKTLSPKNEFRFACPVFGAEVAIAGCLTLRDDYACGRRPQERKGCQACLAASKCPMVRMLQTIQRTGEDPGFHSAEPRTGQLSAELLDHIAPIVVSEHLLDMYGVPPSEREIILANNERTSAGKGRAKGGKPAAIQLEDAPRRRAPAVATEKPDADTLAATTGDMSAAISKAIKREAAAPAAPAPQPAAETRQPAAAPVAPKATPTPPQANVAPATPRDLAKALPAAKPKLSLLEIARQRAAERAA